jgi:hypothetical protein
MVHYCGAMISSAVTGRNATSNESLLRVKSPGVSPARQRAAGDLGRSVPVGRPFRQSTVGIVK